MKQTVQSIAAPQLHEAVGEHIGLELGAKMIKDFQDAHPEEIPAQFIGRNILEQILAQPDCVGINFFHGINEAGQKTLVYVGVNSLQQPILRITSVDETGRIENHPAIVADRTSPSGGVGEGQMQMWHVFDI